METRTSINAKLPDDLLTLFAKERAGRGRMAVQDALEQAITLWLNLPESSSGADEEAQLSATQKHLTVDLTPAKNKEELVEQKVIAYETLHTSNPCQSEISLLTQILQSGTDAYVKAIRTSLQALARAVRIERGGSGKDTGNAGAGVDPRTPKDTGEPKATGGSNSKAQQLVDSVNEDFAEAERGKPAIVPRKKRSGGDGK